MTAPLAVEHAAQQDRFEVRVQGYLCRLDYRLDGRIMNIHHTEVPGALEGQGIASALVQTAVDHARANGLKIRPLCSYVGAWMRRHPEHADLLA
jgi:predicted GNAT family acetyltransferase